MTETKAGEILEELIAQHRIIIRKHDPRTAIHLLDSIDQFAQYHEIPDSLLQIWDSIQREFGREELFAFQKMTMLTLIKSFTSRAQFFNYTDEIRQRFEYSLERIIKNIRDNEYKELDKSNDIFLKDLAICRQKMFPAGAQVVEPLSVVHRSIFFRNFPSQSFRFGYLLLRTGGHKPFYQIHTHLSELEDFNPAGWDRCYLRIAHMLERNPAIKGMVGSSWFYDPALERVSPRLTYLREEPQKNGAFVFYSCIDIDGGALSKSKTREELYDKGQYTPKSYTVVWPREKMIEWARKNKPRISN